MVSSWLGFIEGRSITSSYMTDFDLRLIQELPTPVIALLLAFIFSLPFIKQHLLNSSAPSSTAQASQELQTSKAGERESKPESTG